MRGQLVCPFFLNALTDWYQTSSALCMHNTISNNSFHSVTECQSDMLRKQKKASTLNSAQLFSAQRSKRNNLQLFIKIRIKSSLKDEAVAAFVLVCVWDDKIIIVIFQKIKAFYLLAALQLIQNDSSLCLCVSNSCFAILLCAHILMRLFGR